MTNKNKIAVVTGASAGIGKVFAAKLAEQKYDLFLVARRKEQLEKIAQDLSQKFGVTVVVLALDLTKKEGRDTLFSKTGSVDLLVNNAGFGYAGKFMEDTRDNMLKMIELNITAVTDLTYFYLQGMIEQNQGEMIIVSSTASFQAIPYFSLYTATKVFDRFLAEALYHEVKKHNVHILTLCPGKTDTEFSTASQMDKEKFAKQSMTAESVVNGCLKALKKKKWEYIPGFKNKVRVHAQRLFPRDLISRIAGKIIRQDL